MYSYKLLNYSISFVSIRNRISIIDSKSLKIICTTFTFGLKLHFSFDITFLLPMCLNSITFTIHGCNKKLRIYQYWSKFQTYSISTRNIQSFQNLYIKLDINYV